MIRRTAQPGPSRRSDAVCVRRKCALTQRRSGFFAIELALTLPILGVVLMAIFEFSLLFFARGAVVEASRVGARRACLSDVDPQDIDREVRKVLRPRFHKGLEVRVLPGQHTGDVVAVAVSVPMRSVAPDLLWPIGYSLKNQHLYSETRMIKE